MKQLHGPNQQGLPLNQVRHGRAALPDATSGTGVSWLQLAPRDEQWSRADQNQRRIGAVAAQH